MMFMYEFHAGVNVYVDMDMDIYVYVSYVGVARVVPRNQITFSVGN